MQLWKELFCSFQMREKNKDNAHLKNCMPAEAHIIFNKILQQAIAKATEAYVVTQYKMGQLMKDFENSITPIHSPLNVRRKVYWILKTPTYYLQIRGPKTEVLTNKQTPKLT